MVHQLCPTCTRYAEKRMTVLVPAMAEHCQRTGEDPTRCLNRYMSGVHNRHLAGLPILPKVPENTMSG